MMSETIASGFQLSPQQKHLWLRGAEEFAFNSIVAFLLEGKLDAEALKRSLQEVIARHEILRTTFERRPGMKVPVQIVNENLAPLWAQSDIRSLPADRQRSHVDQVVRQEQGSHFDLVRGPIIRAMLVMLASERHVLVLSAPALSADVATLRNLVSETGQHASTASDEEVFQYADFSAWQNELLQQEDDDSKSGKQFWHSLLADTVLAVRLPFELNPVESKGFQAESIAIPVPAEASRESTSFFAACWQVLQWRLTGQSKIVVGDICDGRNHEEVAGAMGLFTRSLPIPFEFDGGSSFETVKAELEKVKSAAYDQQDHLPIDASSQDLQMSFLAEDVPSKYQAGGLSFSLLKQESANQRYRMQLRCVRNGAACALEIRYDPRYFSCAATEHIGECFSVLMKSAAQDPTSAIADLAIIRGAEHQKVLQEFNRTTTDFPNAQCIHYIFEAQAARVPDQPALRFGETFLTYTELNARSNQLAHMLRRNGVKADVAVGLCLDRSADMIVALLGIMKAGGAYVPLIPDNPKARLAHQLSEIKSPVLITEEKYLTRLPEFSGKIVCLDGDSDLLAKESVNNPEHINTAQNTVYIIYTSGSTGLPKGVAVAHSNLVNYAQSISQKLNAEADTLSFATVSTLAADLGNTAIFPSLISGGCLHVIAYETGMAGNLFSEYVKRHPLDVLKITPSHLSSLLASTEGEGALPRKYLVLGGEAASWDLVRRVQQAGKCAVINHYGPTEATVGCCTFSVAENDVSAWAPATVPIGRPIANDQVYILDHRMRPLPIGVPGELCIGGAGIAKGYLGQPQQTAERFVPNPFSKDAEARIYRTGDLARFLPDGNIEFLGRIDRQIKIRGFRVEPAEIEGLLRKHPAVEQALVTPRKNAAGETSLIAYVVSSKIPAPPDDELRAFLHDRLPEYMVPSRVVMLETLPLNRNGKVDLPALAALEERDDSQNSNFVRPRTPVEEQLARIWGEVLHKERIGVHDNFLELGGHSLLAMQVLSHIRNEFHVQFPLLSFLEAPTLADMASKISECPATETETEEEEIERLLLELDGLSDEEAQRLTSDEAERKKGVTDGTGQ